MIAPSIQPAITLVARSPQPATGIAVVVTLPTFRRPDHLLHTLQSLQGQKTGRRFAVVVMENDAEGRAGADVAAPLFQSGTIEGSVILAHERGNCSAYNAGWQTALLNYPDLEYLMVIDDDELADPDWIDTMVATIERLGVDIAGGPQRPVFSRPGASQFEQHPVFAPPYRRTGPVPALYSSGNLIIRRDVLAAMPTPYLDTRFNFLGGGDSDFLSRCVQRGFKLGWCEEAPVFETIPDRRLEMDWIRARSLRNGVISTLVERRRRAGSATGGLLTFGKSMALLAASPLRGLREGLRERSLQKATYPVYIGLGRVMAHFGYQNEQYRQPEKN